MNVCDTKLLSRNATYRIVGEGYIYPYPDHIGIWPGTNVRATEPGWMDNPLVEQTDTGDVLIDGRTDEQSLVYTPGDWSGLGKRINVEMSLPGDSRVSRVVAHLPTDRLYVASKATLYVKGSDGLWQQTNEINPVAAGQEKLIFELSNVQTDQVKLVLTSEKPRTGPRVGITELEVWGQGPTENQTRGLVRMPTHLDSLRPPQPRNAAASSRLLTRPDTPITVSGTPLTSGEAAWLVDGDRSAQVRVDNDAEEGYSDIAVDVEIDLGVDCYVDSVRVWMPGGRGMDTGHVHDFVLAVSAGEPGNVWMTPGERVANPYWPGDDAPKPYVVPINGVNLVGRRVRVVATLAGRGGLTNRLAMSQIEVFGRPIPGAIETDVTLDQRPIDVTPEPVDPRQMHPQVRWMTEERVRFAWFTDDVFNKSNDGSGRTDAQAMADAGFNVIAVVMAPDRPDDTWQAGTLGKSRDTSADIENRLGSNLAAARDAGLRFVVAWWYGSNHQDPYRRYRGLAAGKLAKKTCCPLDEEYLDRHIGRWARAAAQGGADGFLIDDEMYESDDANYYAGPCICDDCFANYLKTFSEKWRFVYERLPDEARGVWLQANNADKHYREHGASRLAGMYDRIKRSCEQTNPAFIMAKYHVFDDLPGMERGLGSSSIPAPLLSATEYRVGPNVHGARNYQRILDEGFPVVYVPGAYIADMSPEQMADNALLSSLYYGGWFLWHGRALLAETHGERSRGSTRDYLDRITAMHKRLDQLLGQPRGQWPDPPPGITR